jgi:hypothetical protein
MRPVDTIKYDFLKLTNSTRYWADSKSNEVIYFEVVTGRNRFYHEKCGLSILLDLHFRIYERCY